MSKQEFSRLDVLLQVQSGRLRADRLTAASGVSSAARPQAGRCHEPAFQTPRQTQQPPATRCGSHPGVIDCARAIFRLWPELGGGEAGRASRLLGVARDLARLDDRRWAMAGPSASCPLAASAAPAARLSGRTGADRRLGARLV